MRSPPPSLPDHEFYALLADFLSAQGLPACVHTASNAYVGIERGRCCVMGIFLEGDVLVVRHWWLHQPLTVSLHDPQALTQLVHLLRNYYDRP